MDIGNIKEDIKKIRYACRKWGISYIDIEDCIQWVFLKRVEGKGRHQLVSHSVVDWMRSFYVSSKNADYNERSKFRFPAEFDDNAIGSESTEYISREFIRIVSLIHGKSNRDVVIRYLAYGDTFHEIAAFYGVSHTYIAKKYWKAVRSLREVIPSK